MWTPIGVVPIQPGELHLRNLLPDHHEQNYDQHRARDDQRRSYGSGWCSANVNTPTAAVKRQPSTTPSSTTLEPNVPRTRIAGSPVAACRSRPRPPNPSITHAASP